MDVSLRNKSWLSRQNVTDYVDLTGNTPRVQLLMSNHQRTLRFRGVETPNFTYDNERLALNLSGGITHTSDQRNAVHNLYSILMTIDIRSKERSGSSDREIPIHVAAITPLHVRE